MNESIEQRVTNCKGEYLDRHRAGAKRLFERKGVVMVFQSWEGIEGFPTPPNQSRTSDSVD